MIRIAFLLLLAPMVAVAQPKGGTVVSGTAVFPTSPNTLNVTNTPGSIINWQSFSISKEAAPNYIGQSSNAAQLNRAPELNRVPEGRLVVPGMTTLTAPTMPTMPTTPVMLQPPVVAPASATQAVQLPDGRIVFRTTPQ